jgi:hypothetical protein
MAKTRKQRGGAGVKNVLRVTGSTARKLGKVGTYGLRKVGNGVHVITSLLNRGVSAITGRSTTRKVKGGRKH